MRFRVNLYDALATRSSFKINLKNSFLPSTTLFKDLTYDRKIENLSRFKVYDFVDQAFKLHQTGIVCEISWLDQVPLHDWFNHDRSVLATAHDAKSNIC